MGRPAKPNVVWTRGSWKARFTVNGRRRWETTGVTDKSARDEAMRVAWDLYDEIKSGRRDPELIRQTVGKTNVELIEACAHWLVSIEGAFVPKTCELYKMYTRTWRKFFGSLDRINDVGCKDYVAKRLTQVQRETVKKECTALRLFATWAHEHGMLPTAPAVKGPSKKSKGTVKHKRVTVRLTAFEVDELLDALPEFTFQRQRKFCRERPTTAAGRAQFAQANRIAVRDRFIFAWETGMRPEMIDKLAVPTHYTKGAAFLAVDKWIDKTQSERGLPLSDRARAALDRCTPERGGLIFGAHDYRAVLRATAKALGWPEHKTRHLTEHCFRHNRITRWLEIAGDNLAGVQYLSGHAKASTTARYAEATRRAAEAVIAVGASASGRGSAA